MDAHELVGTQLAGKYRLEDLLGQGGMGAVYRARHTGTDREVAVKVLDKNLLDTPSLVERFVNEAKAAAKIEHPAIVDTLDVGELDDGTPFIVFELLKGETLAERLARGPLTMEQAVFIALELLDALDCAHSSGIVHRDVKPQNVFLEQDRDGRYHPKLIDFGVAKFERPEGSGVTTTGTILGSPLYMAPEQARGDSDVDCRVDVWAVGVLVWEMIVGLPPHRAPTAVGVIGRILTVPAEPLRKVAPSVPKELEKVVARALFIDRDRRFSSARAMADALDPLRAIADKTIASGRRSLPEPPSPSEDRSRYGLAALGLGALTATIGIFWANRSGDEATPTPKAIAPTHQGEPHERQAATAAAKPSASASDVSKRNDAGVITEGATADSGAGWEAIGIGPKAPRPASVRSCPVGQSPSLGHCCPNGTDWQFDHCERPLATRPPF